MNEDNRDIDRLLQANVEGQLARIDWDRFNEAVLKRLATAGLRRRSRTKYIGSLAVAAGLVLTAGVLVAVVMRLREPSRPTSRSEGRATVSIQEPARGAGTAIVVLGDNRSGEVVVRCEVTLMDSSGPQQDKQTQPSWCLVARRAPSSSGNARNSDGTNIPCLF